jgi:NADP-dependent 3-hydroxy acid dehydrogenase YdfG
MGLSQIRSSNGDEVLAIPGDIADRQTADRTIFQDVARFGRIDTLVGRFGLRPVNLRASICGRVHV